MSRNFRSSRLAGDFQELAPKMVLSEPPPLPAQNKKKGLKSQPLKVGAGEEGRTPDLMLGKHTL